MLKKIALVAIFTVVSLGSVNSMAGDANRPSSVSSGVKTPTMNGIGCAFCGKC